MQWTTTTLGSGANPSAYGDDLVLTATVSPGLAGGPDVTGTVSFYDGAVLLGSAALTSIGGGAAQATFSLYSLTGGAHSLTAAYSGDAHYAPGSSAALAQTVDPRTSVYTLLSSAGGSSYGQAVTFTLEGISTLMPGVVPPSGGTVTFYDGATAVGTAVLVQLNTTASQAVLTVTTLAVGTHTISAGYAGDGNYATGTSNTVSLTVTKASTATALASSVNPSALCQSVTFTAAVTAAGAGAGTPTGTVTFYDGGTSLGTAALSGGAASLSTSSLSAGSHSVSAVYGGDADFNGSTSNTLTQVVTAAVNWVVTAAPAAPDPQQGRFLCAGPAALSPLTGALLRQLPIDANQHAAGGGGCGCGCGCGCGGDDDNNRAGRAPLGLVYNSGTVHVRPILLASVASDFCAAVPSQIQAQLTWNGAAQGWVTFATTGHNSGDVYALPLQVGTAVATSGVYSWSVEVKTTVGGTVYDSTVSGVLPVVVNAASAFGAGWALAGAQFLLIGGAGVAVVENTTGGYRYFSGTGPSYASPANDQGTLVQNLGGDYTYTAKDQAQTNFDGAGRMTSQVDPHGLTQAFSYGGGLLGTVAQPDGGVATFGYSGGLLASVQEPGGRHLTISYDISNNLTGFLDAANGRYTFSYDGSHRLVNEQAGPLNATYSYSTGNGTLTQVDRGVGTTLAVAAAATQGLGAATAINTSAAAAALTDALGRTTSYTLDALGRTTLLQTADGAAQSWARDAAGNPTTYQDQLGRLTSFTYSGAEDLTQTSYPDGTFTTYQYETTFHQVTQVQDALNHRTTFSYDATTSDLLSCTDALGKVTTHTWSNGLKQTTTDALGRVTTLTWDSSTRRQTAATDALGHVTSYGYDGAGNRTTVQDALGRVTTTAYDGNRRRLTRTDALGGVATFAYDAISNLLSSTDALGRTTSYGYDPRGLPVAKTEAVGTAQQRTTTTSYDAAANVLSTTDALGDVTSYAYDALNRPVAKIDAYGTALQRSTTTAYDPAGNALTAIDPRGTTTSYAYDVRNRQTQQLDAYGTAAQRATTKTYDAVGNLQTVTNPRGTTTSYGYDADNRQTLRIDAYGASLQRAATTVYDAVGNVQSATNAVGATASYAYDALNRPTAQIDAYGSGVQRATTTAYDPVGNVQSTVNPRGTVTSYGYDALNRRTLRLDAYGTGLQRTLTTVYDAVGNVLSATNGLGVATSYAYDPLNRQVARLDAYGTALQRTMTMAYDADSNVTASIDALGYATTYGYDALNRRVTVQDADGGVATTAYDADDNVTGQIDPLGHATTYTYDVLNRRTQATDARGGLVTLSYDPNNNLLSLTDPVGNRTQWLYDALDRKAQETDPLGYGATYAYDALDRLTLATDRNGQQIASGYDLLNRETGEKWYNAGGTQVNALTFTYDANNNLLTAANNAAVNTLAYDALDRKAAVQDPFGSVLTYTYDAADNRTLVQDSFGATTTRVYDALNRTVTILFGGVGQTPLREDFSYTARDQVASQTRYSDLAGTARVGYSTFGYDAVARLTVLQHQNGAGANLANYTNTYDLASRITSETLNGGATTSYAYDATNELTSDAVATYSYDLGGNRTMPGYTTGPANELAGDGTWRYYYDANGNLAGKTNMGAGPGASLPSALAFPLGTAGAAAGGAWSYGYDNRNRLVSARQATGGGVQVLATYVYDALGKRIEKDVTQGGATTTTRFAYDGNEIWADLSSSNALVTRYLRGARVLELLARIASGGAAAWVLADRMGTVRNVVDATGALLDTITYDGYGNVTSETSAANGGQYKYAGYRYDSETGLYRPDPTTRRYYGPTVGNWNGRDPWGFGGRDLSLYRYVRNSPTNGTDPSGLDIYLLFEEPAVPLPIQLPGRPLLGIHSSMSAGHVAVVFGPNSVGAYTYYSFSPGPDGMWFTSEDNLTGISYLSLGALQDSREWNQYTAYLLFKTSREQDAAGLAWIMSRVEFARTVHLFNPIFRGRPFVTQGRNYWVIGFNCSDFVGRAIQAAGIREFHTHIIPRDAFLDPRNKRLAEGPFSIRGGPYRPPSRYFSPAPLTPSFPIEPFMQPYPTGVIGTEPRMPPFVIYPYPILIDPDWSTGYLGTGP